MEKYPRTFHLSFSQEIFSDDKMLSKEIEKSFTNTDIVITEKMDGGNTCLFDGKVFTRTHSEETFHPSFSRVKELYNSILYTKDFDFSRYKLFGENVQAIHSIEYEKLNSPFYLFNILDIKNKEFLSYKEVIDISNYLELKMVKEEFLGQFKTLGELKLFLVRKISIPSYYGGKKEGFVIRKTNSFKYNSFSENVCKFVRKNHVQSDEHWSNNWKEQKIIV